MRVVIDTNVLVSGLLSPDSPPALIVRLIANRSLCVCHDWRILDEYQRVLKRPAFDFKPSLVTDLLVQIKSGGQPVVGTPLQMRLPDWADEKFLEVALTGSARCLITGNLKHFPLAARGDVMVWPPRRFIDLLGGEGV